MSSETKKILLIGAKGYDRAKEGLRVNCVTWDKLSTISNVRDYHVLVINLQRQFMKAFLKLRAQKNDQFGEDGRKQLLDWIDRGRTLRDKNYKGIFIGNSAVTKPLKTLSDRPVAFSDSWKKAAALSQICAMKSEELYLIYLLHKQGKLNLDDFWTKLFTTNGIFDIKPLLPKEKPKDV